MEGDQEVLELTVKNTGPMTALFCEPHPLIEYRTDLFIENNHCFIPPGQSRTITIRAPRAPGGGLTLAQTGWRLSCWNADDVVIEPSRRTCCSPWAGGTRCAASFWATPIRARRPSVSQVSHRGDIAPIPPQCLVCSTTRKLVRFEFPLSDAQAKLPARLRIHTADQAEKAPTKVVVTMNGRRMERSLPVGLGIQRTDPAHLAFPATVEFQVPATDLRPGTNTLEVRVQGDGWFSWDAMDLTRVSEGEGHVR